MKLFISVEYLSNACILLLHSKLTPPPQTDRHTHTHPTRPLIMLSTLLSPYTLLCPNALLLFYSCPICFKLLSIQRSLNPAIALHRRSGIPTPPSHPHALNIPTHSLAGSEPVLSPGQRSFGNYGSAGVPLSPLTSGSYLRSGSLANVLAPWQQAGAQQQQQGLPIGSLEALRATWRPPHNSFGTGTQI